MAIAIGLLLMPTQWPDNRHEVTSQRRSKLFDEKQLRRFTDQLTLLCDTREEREKKLRVAHVSLIFLRIEKLK